MEREHVLLLRRRIALQGRIKAWKRLSPLADHPEDDDEFDEEEDEDDNIAIELTRLPLPSSFPANDAEPLRSLCLIEKQLRMGQAHDSLKELRKALSLRLALTRKGRQARGQQEYFRSQATLLRVNRDINYAATRYRVAYSTLISLGIEAHEGGLKELLPDDISTANIFESTRPLGRGYDVNNISWIWKIHGTGEGMQDSNWIEEGTYYSLSDGLLTYCPVLRVQFLDSKTTLERWKEEIELVMMEMDRTVSYFWWMGGLWHERATHALSPGERAHSLSMRLLFQRLQQSIQQRIVPVP